MKRILIVLFGAALSMYSQGQPAGARDLTITTGKSVLVDSTEIVERVAVANGDLAEAVAITPREVLVNGKAPGETSMIVWQRGGGRMFFDLNIRRNESRLDAVRKELSTELSGQEVTVALEGDSVFLKGTVRDLVSAQRATAIAAALGNGKPINLLRVNVPETETQILLKVRFADVDRTALQQLGANFFSTGGVNTIGSISTGQFTPPVSGSTSSNNFTLSDALNVFLFSKDLNIGATIKMLQNQSLLQMLAEPNVLAINGKPASFLAGGEFPYPTLQGGGAGLGAVTIQFREFGVRLNFIPVMTPRGTIRLSVEPEVSSLDFANGLVFQGFTIPALSTRRVQTEIELDEGQSFAIGGLLDNRTTQLLSRLPGLGDIPLFGKLFRSREVKKTNTELIVLVTPEIVHPIPKGAPLPDLKYPAPFLEPNTSNTPPRTPAIDVTALPAKPAPPAIPVEQLIKSQQPLKSEGGAASPAVQFVPVPLMPTPINPPALTAPKPDSGQ